MYCVKVLLFNVAFSLYSKSSLIRSKWGEVRSVKQKGNPKEKRKKLRTQINGNLNERSNADENK
jgi:hypothetical protein